MPERRRADLAFSRFFPRAARGPIYGLLCLLGGWSIGAGFAGWGALVGLVVVVFSVFMLGRQPPKTEPPRSLAF